MLVWAQKCCYICTYKLLIVISFLIHFLSMDLKVFNTRGFNNMIYTCLHDYSRDGIVGEAPDLMAETIKEYYNKLNQ